MYPGSMIVMPNYPLRCRGGGGVYGHPVIRCGRSGMLIMIRRGIFLIIREYPRTGSRPSVAVLGEERNTEIFYLFIYLFIYLFVKITNRVSPLTGEVIAHTGTHHTHKKDRG